MSSFDKLFDLDILCCSTLESFYKFVFLVWTKDFYFLLKKIYPSCSDCISGLSRDCRNRVSNSRRWNNHKLQNGKVLIIEILLLNAFFPFS